MLFLCNSARICKGLRTKHLKCLFSGLNKFELLFKCDWESIIGQIKYREVQTQGKDYKFIMDSSYGCVKLPSECVVNEIEHLLSILHSGENF